VYCGVGGHGSVAWFVLTEVLGYNNVKFYDGSAEEWTCICGSSNSRSNMFLIHWIYVIIIVASIL
jgi:3-mercaptopyruvate sulfurtransferase SseA